MRAMHCGQKTYLTHITNTRNLRTGTVTPANTSAKRSSPRPLLVVHSGKTTSGRSARARSASKLSYTPPLVELYSPGTYPVAERIPSRDTRRKPRTFARGVGLRVDGEDIAAEPVPVRRPGVTLSGVEDRPEVDRSTGAHTGRMNIGSYLKATGFSCKRTDHGNLFYSPKYEPEYLNPGSPV